MSTSMSPLFATSGSPRINAIRVATFVAASTMVAIPAVALGTPVAMMPCALVIGPTVIAVVLAWREGDGALRRLLRTAVTQPSPRTWYALLLLPAGWAG